MIIWIVSYPKSGNTWIRSIVSSMLYTNNGNFEMGLLKRIPQFPRNFHFDGITDNLSNIDELSKYWIEAQERINRENKISFFKTHNANITVQNFPFTNKANTLATIYIIRDPRNVVSSIANHYNYTINEAKDFMLTRKALKQSTEGYDGILTPISDWGDHYKSWTKYNDNLLLVKYEDLIKNIKEEIKRISIFLKKFVKIETDEKKIKRIIETTNFNNLKKLESKGDFHEYKHRDKNFSFFNKGPNNNWQNTLNTNIKNEIEIKYSDIMKELGYL